MFVLTSHTTFNGKRSDSVAVGMISWPTSPGVGRRT